MTEELPKPQPDYDFTPPEGTEVPMLTDSEAAQALARGDNKTFVKWMTQQHVEVSRRPDSIAEYELQLRIATAYFNASRTEGPEDQQKHRAEALRIITETTAAITKELAELTSDYTEAYKRPDRDERIAKLRGLVAVITKLRPEILR
jgi:hypothetical protein